MELWVRSQDKKTLLQAKSITFDQFIQVEKIGNVKVENPSPLWGISCGANTVGFYETEQRCLEILDEIQNLLFAPRQIVFNKCKVDKGEYNELCEQLKTNGVACVPSDSEIKYLDKDWVLYEMPEK